MDAYTSLSRSATGCETRDKERNIRNRTPYFIENNPVLLLNGSNKLKENSENVRKQHDSKGISTRYRISFYNNIKLCIWNERTYPAFRYIQGHLSSNAGKTTVQTLRLFPSHLSVATNILTGQNTVTGEMWLHINTSMDQGTQIFIGTMTTKGLGIHNAGDETFIDLQSAEGTNIAIDTLDTALKMVDFVRDQILSQAGTSTLTQASQRAASIIVAAPVIPIKNTFKDRFDAFTSVRLVFFLQYRL